ncbi:MAG: protein kinase [Polyangiaceae bacterium]
MTQQPSIECPSCGHRARATDAFCSECGFALSRARTEDAASDPLVGRALPGGYRIVEPLAQGSMGRVYRAEQSNLGRPVAVKVMSNALMSKPEMVERFKNEARAASSLNHPNCVRVYDFGQTPDGRPYFVMELLSGQDLEVVLAQEPLPPMPRVLDITLQILSALEEAHSLEVVHRDLKPANVFVMPQRGGGDLIKVVDFGLAKLHTSISQPGGLVFGTPEYITPEQAMAKDTDPRTDLYALGVMLFEMTAGRRPFDADDPQRLLEMHVYDPPPRIAELAQERSMFGLDSVIERALKKEPSARYQSATDFADALREIVAYRTGDRSTSDRRSWVRAAYRACPHCGNLNPPIARFCGECGETIERESLPNGIAAFRTPTPAPSPPARAPLPSRSPAARRAETLDAIDTDAPPPAVQRFRELLTSPIPEPNLGEPAGEKPVDEEPAPPKANTDVRPAEARTGAAAPARRIAREDSPIGSIPSEHFGPNKQPAREVPKPLRGTMPPPMPSPGSGHEVGSPGSAKLSERPPPDRGVEEAIAAAISSGDANTSLVFLEQLAQNRMRVGDPRGAAAVLSRGISMARADLDKGELEDPIHVVAILSAKLGEAHLETGDFNAAQRALKDALALARGGQERARAWLLMSRVARAQGHDAEANEFLEAAERETATSRRRADSHRSKREVANDSPRKR